MEIGDQPQERYLALAVQIPSFVVSLFVYIYITLLLETLYNTGVKPQARGPNAAHLAI